MSIHTDRKKIFTFKIYKRVMRKIYAQKGDKRMKKKITMLSCLQFKVVPSFLNIKLFSITYRLVRKQNWHKTLTPKIPKADQQYPLATCDKTLTKTLPRKQK